MERRNRYQQYLVIQKNKMNILVVNNLGLGMGGITTHMYNYLEKLKQSNDDINIDLVSTMDANDEMIAKFKSIGCKIIYLASRKKQLFTYCRQLKKLINNNSYDAVHIHGNSGTMIIDLWWAYKKDIPVRIAHCHNSTSNHKFLTRILMPIFEKTYTNAVACSKEAGEWIFGEDNFMVLHNAIDIDKYKFNLHKRKEYRNESGVSGDTLVLGHIGNFNEQKNHEFLIDIFYELQKKIDTKLILIGIGELQENIKAKVKELKIDDKVEFLNIRTDISDLLSSFDVFMLPSKWEGLPVSLIEAQANELPCLVSDNVSRESNLTNLVQFISNENIEKWLNVLLKSNSRSEISSVIDAHARVTEKGYNIRTEVEKLKNLYYGIN